jgi:pyrroline-5-carboxylate reductase
VSLKGKRVGFVGAGNMGEALIKGLVEARVVPPEAIAVTDVRPEPLHDLERRYRIRLFPDNPELVRHSDVVVLAVKPQIMDSIVRELAPTVTREKLLISIAAGVSTARIRGALGRDVRLLRVMPNTPALVLEGATAIGRAAGLAPGDLETAEELFAAVGKTVVLDESLMDAVTGLSGSGPAYVALVVEALADGGVNMGLDRSTALTLAVQTVLGTARLLRETGRHPAVLKDMVSSPGGTTIAGIAALEAGGLRAALMQAVEHATLRSRELGRGAG